ncbi:MAG: SPOR domain-containing protein [Reyranellaceae bacterium]
MLRKFLPAIIVLPLAGCGLPPALMIASYAADGVLLFASGKTSTDHLLSMVEKRDCAVWRVVKSKNICQEFTDGRDPYDDWRDPGEVQIVHADDSGMVVDLEQQAAMRRQAQQDALVARQQKAERILLAQAGAGEPVISARDVVGPSTRSPSPVSSAPLPPVATAPAAPPPAAAMPQAASPTIAAPVIAAPTVAAPTVAAPTVAAPVESAPAKPATAKRSKGGTFVVLGSYKEPENARRVQRQHQALDPSLRHVTVRGEKFTRVVVGPYSRDEAAAIRRQLKTNDGVDAFIAQSCDDKASPSCIAGSDG